MSNWRGRKNAAGNSSYNQNANRLRDKLESRKLPNNEKDDIQRHPPGLKGREIGLWYAQNQGKRNASKSTEPREKRLVSKP